MVNLIYSTPPLFILMFSLSPSLLSFSSFPPSSSLFVRKRVNTPTLLVSLMAPWKPVTPFFTDLRVCASVCVCVCLWVGSGSCSVSKSRGGHSRLYGPLAVIHVNSLKTTEALSSLFSPKGLCRNVKFNPITIVVLFNELKLDVETN